MKNLRHVSLAVLSSIFLVFYCGYLTRALAGDSSAGFVFVQDNELENEEAVSDPLEGFNRAVFKFNDRFYFWILKPVAKVYGHIVPGFMRRGVRNFFYNLNYPDRVISCLFQLKLDRAAIETLRFMVNTTLGIGGFINCAGLFDRLKAPEEDMGQVLAKYGMGHGIYIVWPFFGPMSFRDSIGFTVDYFLQPISYIRPFYNSIGVRSYDIMNDTSLEIGEYEALKESSLDPYVAVRDAYIQHRASQVKK